MTLTSLLLLAPLTAAANLDQLDLPPGFSISVFADNVENARAMARGDDGTIYVGSRRAGKVYAVVDEDGDGSADRVALIDHDLNMPSGLAWHEGSLYVGAVSRILRYDDLENRLDNPPDPVVIRDDLPTERHHGWKYLEFGPDGKLYFPVGAPCNICDEPGFAEIRRINPDGSDMETVARGVRNSVGLAFHPISGELWFTDNGRDMLGDDLPPDELNRLASPGQHFGYPYCHGDGLNDPEFGKGVDCADYTGPAQALGAHVAAIGLDFYRGDAFPAEYHNQIFVAEHGSWNRSSKVGYQISLLRLEGNAVVGYEPFVTGWLQGEDNWGRPADVLNLPDGSLLISDDQGGIIYRLTYSAP